MNLTMVERLGLPEPESHTSFVPLSTMLTKCDVYQARPFKA